MKDWLINVGLQKMGPSAIRAALAAFVGIVLAHSGALAKYGVIYDSASQTLSLHLGTLQEWCDVSGLGLIAAVLMAVQHHTTATITGQSQTGGDTK